jgi:hypothetical protein
MTRSAWNLKLPLVGYFELAFDDRIELQAGEKAAQGDYSFEDHHFASCDESPFTFLF